MNVKRETERTGDCEKGLSFAELHCENDVSSAFFL